MTWHMAYVPVGFNVFIAVHCIFVLQEVRLHYVAAGTEGKPLMLLVHGFPEFWYSWRYQLREFSKEFRYILHLAVLMSL